MPLPGAGLEDDLGTLYLLRHARAAWPQPATKDFDRELEPSGLNDAVALGTRMARQDLFPTRVICSTAKRARDTIREVSTGMDATLAVEFTDDLYTKDAAGYLELIRKEPGEGPLLVVAHNPMLEDLANMLTGKGDKQARRMLAAGFPVCGLALIRFDGPMSTLEPGRGRLLEFLTPETD